MRPRPLALSCAALAVMSTLSGCGISIASSSASDPLTEARIQYCAQLGATMMTMMSMSNGGPTPNASAVATSLQDMVATGTKIHALDANAPASLDTDVMTAFGGQSDQATAGAALTEMHQYCISVHMDPMASTPGQ